MTAGPGRPAPRAAATATHALSSNTSPRSPSAFSFLPKPLVCMPAEVRARMGPTAARQYAELMQRRADPAATSSMAQLQLNQLKADAAVGHAASAAATAQLLQAQKAHAALHSAAATAVQQQADTAASLRQQLDAAQRDLRVQAEQRVTPSLSPPAPSASPYTQPQHLAFGALAADPPLPELQMPRDQPLQFHVPPVTGPATWEQLSTSRASALADIVRAGFLDPAPSHRRGVAGRTLRAAGRYPR